MNRGRVEVTLTFERLPGTKVALSVSEDWFDAYHLACKELLQKRKLWSEALSERILSELMLKREVISDSEEHAEIEEQQILPLIQAALSSLRDAQAREGGALLEDLRQRQEQLRSLVKQLEKGFNEQQAAHTELLKERLKAFIEKDTTIPEERIVAEAAILAEKSDISEELTRIESHIERFSEVTKEQPAGRKLDFLLQEFLREANTVASKIQNAELQQLVVEMKAEIERMKEQVQNIE